MLNIATDVRGIFLSRLVYFSRRVSTTSSLVCLLRRGKLAIYSSSRSASQASVLGSTSSFFIGVWAASNSYTPTIYIFFLARACQVNREISGISDAFCYVAYTRALVNIPPLLREQCPVLPRISYCTAYFSCSLFDSIAFSFDFCRVVFPPAATLIIHFL